MPAIPKQTRIHEGNGRAHNPVPEKNSGRLDDALRRRQHGTDAVKIGGSVNDTEEFRTGSMADVMKRIDGIRYLVRGWIPYGMLTMLLAPPGVGKSAFALYALARVIVAGGLSWFSGARGPKKSGCVLWCDTEGSAAITIQRIKDWGLPANKIKVPFEDDTLRSIILTNEKHLERIESTISHYKIKLVVVDSLRGAHGGDENSSKVAEVLQKLAAIAERTKAAIIIVHHTRKIRADEEFSADSSRGSNALIAMVRTQLGIDRPDKDSDWCRLQMLKENLGLRPRPIGFRIGSQGLEFGEAPEIQHKETQRDRAEIWLRENMESGQWYPAGELLDEAKTLGMSGNAIQRAREALGVTKPDYIRKVNKTWQWKLPNPEEETKATPR